VKLPEASAVTVTVVVVDPAMVMVTVTPGTAPVPVTVGFWLVVAPLVGAVSTSAVRGAVTDSVGTKSPVGLPEVPSLVTLKWSVFTPAMKPVPAVTEPAVAPPGPKLLFGAPTVVVLSTTVTRLSAWYVSERAACAAL
jgi:hypothetical protein